MTVESQMAELDSPPHKIGSQNTPHKLGLTYVIFDIYCQNKEDLDYLQAKMEPEQERK